MHDNRKNLHLPRPKWKLKSSFLTGLGILLVVTVVVLMTLRQSIWAELEVITLSMAVIMFVYLTVVLYLGVRFDKKEKFSIDWPIGQPEDFFDGYCVTDSIGFFTETGAQEGIPGLIIGFILDVLVTIILMYVIAGLMWLGFNIFIVAILPITLSLFYFYRRMLRGIVVKGKGCRRNAGRSLLYALKSTIGYSIWFYTIFMLAHYIQRINQAS